MPVIAVVAVAAVAAPIVVPVGAALAAAVGAGTVSTAVAAAVGSGAIAAGVTVATGGSASDALKAAVITGGAGYIGAAVGAAAGSAAASSSSASVAKVVSAVAQGGTTNTLQALGYGASPEQALQAGLTGAAVSGLTQAGVESVQRLSTQGPQQAGEARLRVPAQGEYQRGAPIAQAPTEVGFTNRVPTGGGEGLVSPIGALYSSRFAPSTAMRGTESGGVQPAYQTGESLITPSGMQMGSSVYRDRPDFVPPSLTKQEEGLLRESLGEAFQYLFRDQPQAAPESPTQLGATRRLGAPLTQASPGSQALAQALRIGDAGAPVFGGEKEEGRRSGWNVESLRYMGNSEA